MKSGNSRLGLIAPLNSPGSPFLLSFLLWIVLLSTIPYLDGSTSAEITHWYYQFGQYHPHSTDGVLWLVYVSVKFQVIAGIIIGLVITPHSDRKVHIQYILLSPFTLWEVFLSQLVKVFVRYTILSFFCGFSSIATLFLLGSKVSPLLILKLQVLASLSGFWCISFTALIHLLCGRRLYACLISLLVLTLLARPSILLSGVSINPFSLGLNIISSPFARTTLMFSSYSILLAGWIVLTLVLSYLVCEYLSEKSQKSERLRDLDARPSSSPTLLRLVLILGSALGSGVLVGSLDDSFHLLLGQALYFQVIMCSTFLHGLLCLTSQWHSSPASPLVLFRNLTSRTRYDHYREVMGSATRRWLLILLIPQVVTLGAITVEDANSFRSYLPSLCLGISVGYCILVGMSFFISSCYSISDVSRCKLLVLSLLGSLTGVGCLFLLHEGSNKLLVVKDTELYIALGISTILYFTTLFGLKKLRFLIH